MAPLRQQSVFVTQRSLRTPRCKMMRRVWAPPTIIHRALTIRGHGGKVGVLNYCCSNRGVIAICTRS